MGPIAKAVTDAINANSDTWEFHYYYEGGAFDPKRLQVYMHTRHSALGPEWAAHISNRCIMETARHTSRLQQEKNRLNYDALRDQYRMTHNAAH